MAIEKENDISMFNLSFYYEQNKDDENMIKYCDMITNKIAHLLKHLLGPKHSIKTGNNDTINNLNILNNYYQKNSSRKRKYNPIFNLDK